MDCRGEEIARSLVDLVQVLGVLSQDCVVDVELHQCKMLVDTNNLP